MLKDALVKAQNQVNTFLYGTNISMEMVIKTTEISTKDVSNTLVETI